MNSNVKNNGKKCSCACKTLAVTTLVRTLWLPVVWSILMLVMTISIGPVYPRFGTLDDVAKFTFVEIARELTTIAMPQFAVSIVISAIFGAIQFSYLNRNSSAGFISSLPLTRTQTFFSYYISGVITVIIPQAVTALTVLAVNGRYGFALCAMTLAVGAVYSIGVYSFGVMMSRFSAHTLGGILFTLFGLAVPGLTEGFIRMLMTTRLYGFYDESTYWISEYIYLLPEYVLSLRGLLCIFAILLFITFAWMLYRRQQFELSGDLIAFRGIREIATVICGIIAGVIGYFLFSYGLLMFALFGVICCVLVNFAIRKRFSIKKAIIPSGVIVLITFMIFAIFSLDLTGFEKRIPENAEIESARVYQRYQDNSTSYYVDGVRVYTSNEPFKIKDDEGIQAVRELHAELLENENYYYSSGYVTVETRSYYQPTYYPYDSSRLVIEYNLKDGSTMKRLYTAYYGKNRDAIRKLNHHPVLKTQEHDILREDISVNSAVLFNTFGQTGLTDKEAKALAEAMSKDILNNPLEMDSELNNFRATPLLQIRFDYCFTRGYDADGKELPYEIVTDADFGTTEAVYPHYYETIKVLRELGYGEYLDFDNYTPDNNVYIEKHNSSDGTKTDVYFAQYIDDTDFVKTLMSYCFTLSGEVCNSQYDTAYRITVRREKNGEEISDFFIFGKADFIENWLAAKNAEKDISAAYDGIPYFEEKYFETYSYGY